MPAWCSRTSISALTSPKALNSIARSPTSPEYLTNNTELLREQLGEHGEGVPGPAAYRASGVISTLDETKEAWNAKYVKIQAELLDDGL